MCDEDSSKCVQGAKQMIIWNQLTGNNVVTTGSQTPAYNVRNGFKPGAQDDIFAGPSSSPSGSASSSASPSTTSSGSISISVAPTAPTHVQAPSVTSSMSSTTAYTLLPVSTPTTLSTVVKPDSTSTGSTSILVVPTLPGEQLPPSASDGSPATVTVTVTATPTHPGRHYKDCWVDDEADD